MAVCGRVAGCARGPRPVRSSFYVRAKLVVIAHATAASSARAVASWHTTKGCDTATASQHRLLLCAVFHAGPSTGMNWFTVGGQGGRRSGGSRPGGDMMNGNAVMYDSGKILTCGGALLLACLPLLIRPPAGCARRWLCCSKACAHALGAPREGAHHIVCFP